METTKRIEAYLEGSLNTEDRIALESRAAHEEDFASLIRLHKEINEIIRMRYIDINDRLVMSFLNIIDTDPELQKTCRNIYSEINDINELTISQVFDSGS